MLYKTFERLNGNEEKWGKSFVYHSMREENRLHIGLVREMHVLYFILKIYFYSVCAWDMP